MKLKIHKNIKTISFKLSGSFCLLNSFIVVVGVSAYTSASNASIYFFSDKSSSISTNKKTTLKMFSDYTQSEHAQQYYWYGKASIIDEALNIDSNATVFVCN